jgi:hypothetical protein
LNVSPFSVVVSFGVTAFTRRIVTGAAFAESACSRK